MIDHLTISRAAANLGVSWHTANTAILEEGRRILINDPARFEGVTTIGVDEHVWRHTRRGDNYVPVIIDLTPVREKRSPARLLDMVPGRSKQVFSRWLAARTQAWRDAIEIVAMGGFTGFKTASQQHLPDATEVMDPFHVVQLAGDALDRVRQRVQRETLGHRGRSGDPIDVVKATTPTWFVELRKLAYTLDRRRVDILAYFDHLRTSNRPTEAINGRLEHLRGSALGFRNLSHYIARSLLETGGFKPRLHPQFR